MTNMKAAERTTLTGLSLGTRGIVQSLEAEGLTRRRLLDLGLVPGTVVESLRRSPAGDPTAFRIRGAVIALRSEEGCMIKVRPI
jgi:ferrous iron transport protein A